MQKVSASIGGPEYSGSQTKGIAMSTEENGHVKGEMDISMHEGTYAGFMTLSKVGIVGIVVLLAVMGITLV